MNPPATRLIALGAITGLAAAASRSLRNRQNRLAQFPVGIAKAIGITERRSYQAANLRKRAAMHRTGEAQTEVLA